MEVSAYKKSFTGLPASITVITNGEPLPQVSGLVVEVSKTDGTTVTLRWDGLNDGMHKVKWEYGIYYALNTTDLLSGVLRVETL
jgi:hypothetical protein